MADAPVVASRHLAGAAATISVTWNDEYGEPAAAGGAVTVRVQKADGTDLITAGSSTTTGSSTGVYTRTITATQTALMNVLTATWTDASTGATRRTLHEISGGFFFPISAARVAPWSIGTSKADDVALRNYRRIVEDECEKITGVGWVPRYARCVVSGNDEPAIVVPFTPVRSVRSVRQYTDGTTYTSLSATELGNLAISADGTITRVDGNVFDDGTENIVVEVEYGADQPPPDLLDAVMSRLVDRVGRPNSGVQDRAETFTMQAGGTIRFAQTGLYSTGLPDVDGIYRRYSRREARIPGRVVDYDPQRNTLFHGGHQ